MGDEKDDATFVPPTLEVQRAWALPTLNSNRFIITVWPGRMRLAFGEQIVAGHQPNMHVAVSMGIEDALELADMIKEYARGLNPNEANPNDNGE